MIPGHKSDDATRGRRALLLLSIAALAVGGYYFWTRQDAVEPPQPVGAPPVLPADAPPVSHPLPPDAGPAPLPALAESDAVAAEQVAALFGPQDFTALFFPDDLIRRITVSVDNLPRDKLALRLRALRPLDSQFVAGEEEGRFFLGPDNYARYEPPLRLLESLDPDAVVRVYVRLYPLFQAAYQELGNLDGYFNDRVVEVIDHLLATPEIDGPVELVRPNVLYQFADASLESRSAGQKLLLRMGPENAARVKAELRELRSRVAVRPPG